MLILRYVRHFRRLPRLLRPRTFTEHVLVKLLFDRDPKLTLFADKFAVRRYVAQMLGGEQNLTMLYATADRPEEIGHLSLPNRFIMKPNHLSGQVKVVTDLAAVERAELEALAALWFRQNLGFERGEWAYRDIRPRVLFEELLEFEGRPPSDYRIYCFRGEPRLLSVTRDRLGPDPTGTLYDAEFRMLPVRHVGAVSRYVAIEGSGRRTTVRCSRSPAGYPRGPTSCESISTTSAAGSSSVSSPITPRGASGSSTLRHLT